MSASRLTGDSPPRATCTDAGDAEADSMIGRFGRSARAPWKAAVRLLALFLLIAAPELALARPSPVDPGPVPEGDPTADDQPSPTPKQHKSRSFAGKSTLSTPELTGPEAREQGRRLAWQSYLRVIARITLR